MVSTFCGKNGKISRAAASTRGVGPTSTEDRCHIKIWETGASGDTCRPGREAPPFLAFQRARTRILHLCRQYPLYLCSSTMSGFFGFRTELPERRGPQQFSGFQASNTDQTFALSGAGEEEDLAVYTWGEGLDSNLLEGGDDMNDETFGGGGNIGGFAGRLLQLDLMVDTFRTGFPIFLTARTSAEECCQLLRSTAASRSYRFHGVTL